MVRGEDIHDRGRSQRSERRRGSVPLVGMHAFEVRENDVAVEHVTMFPSCVLDDGIDDRILVVANEVASTAWTCLLERHPVMVGKGRHLRARRQRSSPVRVDAQLVSRSDGG